MPRDHNYLKVSRPGRNISVILYALCCCIMLTLAMKMNLLQSKRSTISRIQLCRGQLTKAIVPFCCSTSLRETRDEDPELVSRATKIIDSHLSGSTLPSHTDLRCIEERQVCNPVTNLFAVTKEKCKYGFPQAFVQLPVGFKDQMNSGMLRLSCPHLVKFIDKYETVQLGIESLNALLTDSPQPSNITSAEHIDLSEYGITSEDLRNNFLDVNKRWQDIRNASLTEREKQLIYSTKGITIGDQLVNSGLIGITPMKINDVKCLHAHVADRLLRGKGSNLIGEITLNELQKKHQVDPRGCSNCNQQCDVSINPSESTYWYTPNKNKQRLRTKKMRRHEHKLNVTRKLQSYDENRLLTI